MQKTSIEWALNPDGTQGYSWNPLTGCLNGCEYCYARKLANTRLKERYLANENIAINGFDVVYIDGNDPKFTDPFYPRFWPEKLDIRRKYDYGDCRNHSKRRGVFVCDMSDLLGIGVPPEWTYKVFQMIRACPQDRFYLLTKQPQNLIKFSPFPDNAWVGVSATTDDMLSSAILYLHNIKAKTKYISFEPLLEPMKDLSFTLKYSRIVDWVIIGAQTKPTVMPKIEWVQEIVKACDQAGVKVFLKDSLKPLMKPVYEQAGCISNFFQGGDGEIPALRQEFPK